MISPVPELTHSELRVLKRVDPAGYVSRTNPDEVVVFETLTRKRLLTHKRALIYKRTRAGSDAVG